MNKLQPAINMHVLDEMVQQYVAQMRELQGCVMHDFGGKPEHICHLVKQLILEGDIKEDMRLVFKLKKQLFVEIVKSATPNSDTMAVACARKELAPLALDAYPEAYDEFKHIMSMLVFHGQQAAALVAFPGHQDFTDSAREDLANTIFHTLASITGSSAPPLHLLLGYLCNLHNRCRDTSSSLAAVLGEPLARELLLPTRDEGPLFVDSGPSSSDPPRETEVQALMQGVGVPRHAAIQALRRAGNRGVLAAVKQELSRLRLDEHLVLQLVTEYAAFRGLEGPEDLLRSMQAEVMLETCSSSIQHGMGPVQGVAHPMKTAETGRSCAGQQRQAAPSTTVCTDMQRAHQARSSSCSPPSKIMRTLGPALHAKVVDGGVSPACGQLSGCASGSSSGIPDGAQQIQTLLAGINKAAEEEDVGALEAAVRKAAPELLDSDPILLFNLRRCQYVQLIELSATVDALRYARTELAPLASAHPILQPELWATMSSLLPGVASSNGWPTMPQLLATLQAHVSAHLGLRAPRLVQLLQVLLQTHQAWFQRQRCSDIFAAELKVDALQSLGSKASTAGGGATGGSFAGGGQDLMQVDHGGSDDDDVNEEKVMQVMMITELPRANILDLLREHHGNVEIVVNRVFGEAV